MPFEPDVVDLRSCAPEPDIDDGGDRPANRAIVFGGLGLLVLGLVLGWLAGSAGEPVADEPAPETVAPVLPTPPAPQDPDLAAATTSPTALDTPAAPIVVSPDRVRVGEAGVTALADAGILRGPVTLVPGLDTDVEVRVDPSGRVSILLGGLEPQEALTSPAGSPIGYPLAPVADGLLYVPTEYALGAVAYWGPRGEVALPVPDEPYRTSYLSARGDLGVFLSAGEIVVRDLRRFEDVVRIAGQIDGSAVSQAWLSPDQRLIVLVALSGRAHVLGLDGGDLLVEFVTDTPLRGVAWIGPDQLAYLAEAPESQVVRALDVGAGIARDVARLEGGANWKLAAQDRRR